MGTRTALSSLLDYALQGRDIPTTYPHQDLLHIHTKNRVYPEEIPITWEIMGTRKNQGSQLTTRSSEIQTRPDLSLTELTSFQDTQDSLLAETYHVFTNKLDMEYPLGKIHSIPRRPSRWKQKSCSFSKSHLRVKDTEWLVNMKLKGRILLGTAWTFHRSHHDFGPRPPTTHCIWPSAQFSSMLLFIHLTLFSALILKT